MTNELTTKFENPPVTETAISAQFAPIAGFTSGHFGWYWKEFLDSSWVKTIEAAAIPDQFERFGEDRAFVGPQFSLQLLPANQPGRLQIVNIDNDRVIQIQNTKFIYNWRKRESIYPSFRAIYPEFSDKLEAFNRFLGSAGLGAISINQWEITYINHIPKSELWQNSGDWCKILPGVYPAPTETDAVRFESAAVELHFEIPPGVGRLHVAAQHGRANEGGNEVLVLHLTARGPVADGGLLDGLDSGLKLGHWALVDTFTKIASHRALEFWGMRR